MTFTIQWLDVEAKYLEIREAVNCVNQISWRIMGNNKIVDADKDNWIKQEKYKESIIKVIGEAIGNCITDMEEFKGKSSKDCITFAATPNDVKYTDENWNAVILWNYLNVLKGDIVENRQRDTKEIFNEVYDRVFHYYNETYHITGLKDILEKAICDIKEYSNELDLANEMGRFVEVTQNVKDRTYPELMSMADQGFNAEGTFASSKYKPFYIAPLMDFKSASYAGHSDDRLPELVKSLTYYGYLLESFKVGNRVHDVDSMLEHSELTPIKISIKDEIWYINNYSARWSYVNNKSSNRGFIYDFYNISDHILNRSEREKQNEFHGHEYNFSTKEISPETLSYIKKRANELLSID